MAYIEISNCSKVIKGVTILDNITLSLEKNKIHGFIGINGSGKTMLFKSIIGLVDITDGEIKVNGSKIESGSVYPVSRGGMIENNGLWPYLNARENLEILASIKKVISKDEIPAVIERVGLDPYSKKNYSKYSLGMKQRLVLAQALMEKPELLVLDEPTNALDKDGIEMFKNIIAEEKARGATVLLASHSLSGFEDFCDTVTLLEGGKICNAAE